MYAVAKAKSKFLSSYKTNHLALITNKKMNLRFPDKTKSFRVGQSGHRMSFLILGYITICYMVLNGEFGGEGGDWVVGA